MRSLKILAALLATSLIAVPVLAESAHNGRDAAAAHAKKSPAEREAKRTERRTAALKQAGVDDARTRQAVAVMAKFDTERAPVEKQMRESVKKLRAAKKSNDKQAAADAKNAVKTSRDKLREIGGREKAALAQILKPAELAKLGELRHERGAGKHGHRGHRGEKGQEKNG